MVEEEKGPQVSGTDWNKKISNGIRKEYLHRWGRCRRKENTHGKGRKKMEMLKRMHTIVLLYRGESY